MTGVSWCENCSCSTPELPDSTCNICCEPLSDAKVCTRCHAQQPAFKQLKSWRIYSGALIEAIHSLKYDRNIGVGLSLAYPLMDIYNAAGWQIDMIIPVPISQERLRERGYNQTALLAYPLALYARKPYKPRALKRLKTTHTQVGLSESDRHTNLLGAFKADPLVVNQCNVLLVDDVATTGSTLEACSQALVIAGARDVYCLTLAKTMLVNKHEGSVHPVSPNSNPNLIQEA